MLELILTKEKRPIFEEWKPDSVNLKFLYTSNPSENTYNSKK